MGRLIDADEAIKDMQYYHDDCAKTSVYTRLGFETAMEVIKDAPTVEAIPKAEYEARLKADVVAMLTEIQLEIEEKASAEGDWIFAEGERFCSKLIQQKIDALKEQTDDSN